MYFLKVLRAGEKRRLRAGDDRFYRLPAGAASSWRSFGPKQTCACGAFRPQGARVPGFVAAEEKEIPNARLCAQWRKDALRRH